MRKKLSKYLNIYVISGLIAFFSVFYIISYMFLFNDIQSGSSREMKKKYCEKYPQKCKLVTKQNAEDKQ